MFLGDQVQLDENCRTKCTIRWHWIAHLNNESMPLCQNVLSFETDLVHTEHYISGKEYQKE